MVKDTPSLQQQTASNPMGGDGWLTLMLSTAVIALSGGLTLLWQGRVVWQCARHTPAALKGEIELVLIPGVRLEDGKPNHDFLQRLQRGKALHHHHRAKLLLMGGITGGNAISEAQAAQKSLRSEGVGAKDLLLEDSSRNTLENLRNARELLRSAQIENFALVSNRYHLARCQALANGLGLRPRLCAAEPLFTPKPRLLLEAYYLHWYHTGKLWSRLTRNRYSLARIS